MVEKKKKKVVRALLSSVGHVIARKERKNGRIEFSEEKKSS